MVTLHNSKSYPKAARTNFTKLSTDHLQFLIGVALGSCFFSTPNFLKILSISQCSWSRPLPRIFGCKQKVASTIHWGSATPVFPDRFDFLWDESRHPHASKTCVVFFSASTDSSAVSDESNGLRTERTARERIERRSRIEQPLG